MEQPFVDFYNKHNVIPTRQNIKNFNQFLHQRNYLYTTLGIPLAHLKNKKILEFGPGGGWNAIATSFYKPDLYVFVDNSKASLNELKKRKINARKIKIVKSDIFKFKSKKKFDLLIIEGTIPNQLYPKKMLKHVSKFVTNNGILITTTTSGTSLLSEFCRRIFRNYIYENEKYFDKRVNLAEKIFKSHLKTLNVQTRPTKDWVIDVIMQPQSGKDKIIFSMKDSLKVLKKKFDFFGSQPKFLLDDRFYKQVKFPESFTNKLFFDQFEYMELGMIDYRVPLTNYISVNNKSLKKIKLLCNKVCKLHNSIIEKKSYKSLNKLLKLLKQISNLLPKENNLTKKSISNFISDFPQFINDGKISGRFKDFSKWWGRGQQYISFIKKN